MRRIEGHQALGIEARDQASNGMAGATARRVGGELIRVATGDRQKNFGARDLGVRGAAGPGQLFQSCLLGSRERT
jgi:hypothetical protein